jgi:hypothetical protein
LTFGVWRSAFGAGGQGIIVGRAELCPAAAGLVQLPPPTRQGSRHVGGIEIEDEVENGMTPNSSTTNSGIGGEKNRALCYKFDA